ncbi:HNH endonuclease [Brevibacillus sp. IT-7CA2]|uniref:hypothetical protein n=1 Tax=Brevibacillus sp. IT-7CA2 TaxID=3026436 RepID=UPI0039E13300
MKFCIYLKKTEPEVTFKSEEHIFPAGVGGIQKLPLEYVSHDCNNAFSSMELYAMRYSVLALHRQFVGPGKRGNLNPKNATKSTISLMSGVTDLNQVEFGYISLGQPYSISQIKIHLNGTCNFISDTSYGDITEQIEDFKKELGKYNSRYTLHKDERLNQEEFILGVHEGKWHVALSNNDLELEINKFIEKLIVQKPFENQTPSYRTERPKVEQTIQFDDRYFRLCAKIIFNYLAFIKGQGFVLKNCFDSLRKWIVNGGENKFAALTGRELNYPIPYPEQAHKLFIVQDGKYLNGFISFYGDRFETQVKLCDDFEGMFQPDGFICDWQQRQEFRHVDYINSLVEKFE